MPFINRLTRRDFLSHTLRAGGALGLAALTQVPPFARRALAEGTIGQNGKKLLFIFLRGANDALNSCIPVLDAAGRPGLLGYGIVRLSDRAGLDVCVWQCHPAGKRFQRAASLVKISCAGV
jgi:uncharacterized protein (DUF1501 family)